MGNLLEETRVLMPGRARSHWIVEEEDDLQEAKRVYYQVTAHDAGTIYKTRQFKEKDRSKVGDYAREIAKKVSKKKPKWGWLQISKIVETPPPHNPHGIGKSKSKVMSYYSYRNGEWTKKEGNEIKNIGEDAEFFDGFVAEGAQQAQVEDDQGPGHDYALGYPMTTSKRKTGKERKRQRQKTEARDESFLHPYGSGMWVVRVEDFLKKFTKKQWRWDQRPMKDKGSIRYKWKSKGKPRGALTQPAFVMWVKYNKGKDLYDVESAYMDHNGQVMASKTLHGLYKDQVTDPKTLFGWAQRKWKPKTGITESRDRVGKWKKKLKGVPSKVSGPFLKWLRTTAAPDMDDEDIADAWNQHLKNMEDEGKVSMSQAGRWMESIVGAPQPFVDQQGFEDWKDEIVDQIDQPSWTYPDWALPRQDLSEALTDNKIRAAIWKRVPPDSRSGKKRDKSREIMMTGPAARSFGVRRYSTVNLDELEGDELKKLARAVGVLK